MNRVQFFVFSSILSVSFFAVANEEVAQLMNSYTVASADSHLLQMSEDEMSKTPYTIQIATYMNETDAVAHVNEIKNQEKSVFYFPSFVRGQVWFKVCVGQFSEKTKAEEYRKSFAKKFKQPFATVVSLLERPSENERLPASVESKSKPAPTLSKNINEPTQKVEKMAEADPMPSASPSSVVSMNTKYSVQIAAHPNESLAKNHTIQLTSKGYAESFYEKATVKGQDWYRVFVGKFETASEAEKLKSSLSKEMNSTGFFVRKIASEK